MSMLNLNLRERMRVIKRERPSEILQGTERERERGMFPSLSVSAVFYWPHLVGVRSVATATH